MNLRCNEFYQGLKGFEGFFYELIHTRKGTYSCTTVDLLMHDCGFTDAFVRIDSSAIWDLLKRRGLKRIIASARRRNAEGSLSLQRALGN